MKLVVQPDDAPDFVALVEQALNGIVCRYAPSTVILIKIDNWFGARWLGFAGKFLGLAGVTLKARDKARAASIRIPPFVPERVVSQRRFVAPAFKEVDPGEPVHKHVPSRTALRRKASVEAPGETIIWYSGNSKANGRGSLMAYLPLDSSYWPWFVELEKGAHWRITEIRGIKAEDFSNLAQLQNEAAVQNP